jgi:hypothetical protein
LQATHLKLLIGQVAGDFFEEAFEGWSWDVSVSFFVEETEGFAQLLELVQLWISISWVKQTFWRVSLSTVFATV